ncbi:PREDICTED: uncharacterized protein LOC105570727 [Vollenhovia emeryi]|uniref:uncharacterized protein LOC105570727 n=1 Tax=Vollenhovia emeryi TaxID=411798 RepID=UPI0005F54E29|nr:PREDICTED: uncharacterized protein LOC105570727 [Vollenhovia emeryi]
MGKSKKRKRPHSRDRLASLEDKLSRLIDVIEQREVKALRRTSAGTRIPSYSSHQSSPGVQSETESDTADLEIDPNQSGRCRLCTCSVLSGSIFGKYRRKNRHSLPFIRNNLVGFTGSPRGGNVTFVQLDNSQPTVTPTEDDSLTRELFASELVPVEVPSWNDLVTDKWRDLSHKGLPAEQRDSLLQKYSVIKRDEYHSKDQNQVGIVLCALGEAISELLKPELQRSLVPEARSAVLKINEGAKILADLFYRPSLSRRAQIMPTLNLIPKNTADNLPVNDFLFGTDFGEELKKASTLEKTSRAFVKTPLPVSRKVQQPIKQPFHAAPSTSKTGNARAPATSQFSATRRAGASTSSRRTPYRSRSRSRRR